MSEGLEIEIAEDPILETAVAELRRVWALARQERHSGEIGLRVVFHRGHCVRHGSLWGRFDTAYATSRRGGIVLVDEAEQLG